MQQQVDSGQPKGAVTRILNSIETVGNKLPDPAVIFFGRDVTYLGVVSASVTISI